MERTPYAHKVRYGVTGAPILTEDQMDGSHAPGVGISPTLIELAYIPARYDKPARIDASVTGWWTRFGKLDEFGGQMTTHFKNGPEGWPAWLAEEARLHDQAEAQQEVRRLSLMVDEYAAGARSLSEKLRESREDCDRSDEGARRALEQRQEMAEERYVLQEQRDRLRTELASARTSLSLEVDWIIEHCPEHGCVEPETEVCHCEIAERLRRLAVVPAAVEEQPTARGEWCKCSSCWGWFVEEHPGEDLDELGRDLSWWSGLPEHRDAPTGVAVEEQPDTNTPEAAKPTSHTWTFEVCYEGDKWHGCGPTYDNSVFDNAHETAQEDFQHRAENDKQRRRFRMICATTTYAVEAEHTPDAEE